MSASHLCWAWALTLLQVPAGAGALPMPAEGGQDPVPDVTTARGSARNELLRSLLRTPRPSSPSQVVEVSGLAAPHGRPTEEALARDVLLAWGTEACLDRLIDLLPLLTAEEGPALLRRFPRTAAAVRPLLRACEGDRLPAALRALAVAELGATLGQVSGDHPPALAALAAMTRSVDPVLAGGALQGLEDLLGGMGARGELQRLERVGSALLAAAAEPGPLALELGRIALLTAGGLDLAAQWFEVARHSIGARQLSTLPLDETSVEGATLSLAEGILGVGAGDLPAALEAFDEALEAGRGIVRRRASPNDPQPFAAERAAAVRLQGLALVGRLFARMLQGMDPQGPEGRELARRVHAVSLLEDVEAAHRDQRSGGGLDALLDAHWSPVSLLVGGRRLRGLDTRQSWDTALRLLDALGEVADWELPGFRPSGEVLGPLEDPERSARLDASRKAAMASALRRQLQRDRERMPPFVLESPESTEERALLRWQLREAQRLASGPLTRRTWLASRVPSALGLRLAQRLRAEGFAERASSLAGRVAEDLEGRDLDEAFGMLIQERRTRALLAQGSAHTDLDEPVRARTILLEALGRAEDLLGAGEQRELSTAAMRGLELLTADVLTALSVNSNVKLGKPEEAVAWVERAHELRGDSWSRLLLACYRARAGRGDEARTLLREVQPSPELHYNLACTWALLGEADQALAWLERELAQLGGSETALRRQKDWAREDPDLSSLRDDSRFRALVE